MELSDLNLFIDQSRHIECDEDLRDLMSSFTREIGFDHFSLYRFDSVDPAEPIRITDYPSGWVEQVIKNRYYVDDPVYVASRRALVGFRRDQLCDYLELTTRHNKIIADAVKSGLGDWFAVPAHLAQESSGLATFIVRAGRPLPLEQLPMAQLAGTFGYEAARRLRRHNGPNAPRGPVPLTPRQVDCLLLIARGKTDWEIGTILGLAEDTVGKYIEDARRRYDVSRRSQLIVRAVFDGHFSLQEALG
ncbi:MAG: hypothetical protein B7Y45_00900 [Sphingomonas sp. 28-66-16]|nr:MAG: hypothetical protein B7Y45_00900 [Sphingomonas sp. 28-66-16]